MKAHTQIDEVKLRERERESKKKLHIGLKWKRNINFSFYISETRKVYSQIAARLERIAVKTRMNYCCG
jgi:hypothetical protein